MSDVPPRVPPEGSVKATDTIVMATEVFYQAHIFPTPHTEHHGEGATPAQALVNAALHWERYERK